MVIVNRQTAQKRARVSAVRALRLETVGEAIGAGNLGNPVVLSVAVALHSDHQTELLRESRSRRSLDVICTKFKRKEYARRRGTNLRWETQRKLVSGFQRRLDDERRLLPNGSHLENVSRIKWIKNEQSFNAVLHTL